MLRKMCFSFYKVGDKMRVEKISHSMNVTQFDAETFLFIKISDGQ